MEGTEGTEEIEAVSLNKNLLIIFLVVIVSIGVPVLILAGVTGNAIGVFVGLILLCLPGYFLFAGIKVVQRPEIWTIEFLGNYYETLKPGVHWVCPHLMFVRTIIPGWLRPIRLFVENPAMDFKEGGTAALVDPHLWVRVVDAKRATYKVANWQDAARELTETFLKSLFGSLTVDQTIMKVYIKRATWWDLLKTQFPTIEESFEDWGLEGQKITITDFQWGPEVVAQRQEVFKAILGIDIAKSAAKAAKFDADKEATRIGGVIGRIKKIMTEELGYTKKKAEEFAPKVFNFVKAAETGSLFLTSLGGEEIGPFVSKIVAIIEETEKKIGEKEKKKAG